MSSEANFRSALASGLDLRSAVQASISPGSALEQALRQEQNLSFSMRGIDPELAEILKLPEVCDVLINGPGEVWVDRGKGLEPWIIHSLDTPQAVRAAAVRMAGAAGKRLDDSCPIVDANLGQGLRLHAVLPPLSPRCALISLRVARSGGMSLNELLSVGLAPHWFDTVIRQLVMKRASVLISGQTGSGKTTLLSAVLSLVDPQERILCIEEVSELQPHHPHLVQLQSRRANVEHTGEVSLSDLLKAALRMRPDRLVLGEARGAEIREMLMGLNTGHPGGWATIHANNLLDVPARLVALGALAGMDRDTVTTQALPAFDALIHLEKTVGTAQSSTSRRISQVGFLHRDSAGQLGAEIALHIKEGTLVPGSKWQEFCKRFQIPPNIEEIQTHA